MTSSDATYESCSICGCSLHRGRGHYARYTVKGRSHASRHHYVAERFFGRSRNNGAKQKPKMFNECPWEYEGKHGLFCYECHEVLLHNPVLLPEDIERFATLVKREELAEAYNKPENPNKIAGRIQLFHKIISRGLEQLLAEEETQNKGINS